MEFKGTKGLRVLHSNHIRYGLGIGEDDVKITLWRDDEETKANVQAILHMSEMLEMLETVLKDYHNIIPQSEARDNRMRQINDLLTRTTTIK